MASTVQPDGNFVAGQGEMATLIRQKDWSKTPLGPAEDWPQSLRTTVSLCLASNFPINIIWGPEHTQIYNDGYRVVCGDAHPRALGENYSVTWASAWPAIGEPFARALAGETSYLQNQRMFLARNGYLEETFFTFSHSPIRDESGGIGGLFHPVTETTDTMLAERRTRALRDLGASLGGASDEADLASRAVEVLSRFEFDLPFVLFYQLEPETLVFRLVADHAVPITGTGAPPSIAAEAESPWPIAEALRSSKAVEVGELQSQLQGWCTGPYKEAPNRAFILPIPVPGAARIPAVIVAGASPRLPMNEAYRSFYELLAVTISSALATVRARDDERRRAQALAALDRAKTAFFSNVSHEFRTPLTLMLGPLQETIADPEVPRQARELLQLAHHNSLRLMKLVNSLLDFSRIEAGRVDAFYEPTDLAAVTRDIASTFRSTIERAGLRFVVECEELGEPVYIDLEMWEKIVLNLLSNAFKFTIEGSIEVRLHRHGSEAVFEVSDTGMGVPEHEMPRLFERFHRVESTQGRTLEGSGIGLALVQELVKLHGAAITVTSELGRGTTFLVRLLLGAEHLPAARIGQARTLTSTAIGAEAFVQEARRWISEKPGETSPRLPASTEVSTSSLDQRFAATFGARVLLADDNADMRSYVSGRLSPFYSVEAVADGEQVLAAARERRPDLILSDVMMPRLDGFELIKRLRIEEGLQNIPVILLSARAGEESRIEGLDAGADDYLVKPFSARELVARVGAMLERERLHREARATLEAASRQKDEFLAMLAHELRNPLAAIRNAGELLSRTQSTNSRPQAGIDVIRRQVAQLTRLVDDLLDVSRITQARIELKRRPLELASVIAQAVETVEPLLREKQHKLSITSTSGYQPICVDGDSARLVQCVVNVLTNAAKYTDPGGEIRVQTRSENSSAVIEISDTGVGISPELLPRIFDLFVQSDRTLDRSLGGLGIGLSVVKRLIEMHDGQVTGRSQGLGRGSTFEIRLPLIEPPNAPSSETAPFKAPPRRVLIVDDNSDSANSLAALLQLDMHEAEAVFTAHAALSLAVAFKPDLVLLDIGLPDMDGYEVARRLRALPGLHAVRLVALTGYGQAEDRQRAREAGFDDHLVKPIDFMALERTLAGISGGDGKGEPAL